MTKNPLSGRLPWPPYLKRIIKFIALGLCAYFIFITCFAVYNNIWFENIGIGFLQKSTAPSNFAISFHASAMESLLFFLCSGVIALAISIPRPEYGDFETKLYYLFPRVHLTEKGKEYCRASINKLACISTKTKITISIDEYNRSIEAFKLSTDHEYHLLNLHNNIAFKDTLSVKYKLDDAVPTDFGNHCWGQIKKIRTVSNHQNPDECKNLLESAKPFISKEHKEPFNIEIKANDNLILDISSWTWNKFISPQNSRVTRFTELLQMTITNNTGEKLNLIIHKGELDYEEFELDIGSSRDIYNDVATPQDVISYTLKGLQN